jgi:hypothetical protein
MESLLRSSETRQRHGPGSPGWLTTVAASAISPTAWGRAPLGSVPMPAHDVTMNLSHPITVKNVDVEFEVRSDGELMGKVQISKGGIDWTPFKSHPRTASWEQFAAWMEGTA